MRAIEHARRRLALDQLNETAHRRLIAFYGESGERALALAQYRDCVRILHRELGVAPTEETTAVYRAVREGGTAAVEPPPRAADTATRLHPLVGRERSSRAPRGVFAGRLGRPLRRARRRDGDRQDTPRRRARRARPRRRRRCRPVRCIEDESELAYGCAIELIRSALREGSAAAVDPVPAAEAARLVPELGTPPTPTLDGPGAQARFLDGVARVLVEATAGERPGLLVVDDVHWADASSLEVLAFLVRRLRDRPVSCSRPGARRRRPQTIRRGASSRTRRATDSRRHRPEAARPRRRRRARRRGGGVERACGAALRGDAGTALLRRRIPRLAGGRRVAAPRCARPARSARDGSERGRGPGRRRGGRPRATVRPRPHPHRQRAE